jgi:hypothetical protein
LQKQSNSCVGAWATLGHISPWRCESNSNGVYLSFLLLITPKQFYSNKIGDVLQEFLVSDKNHIDISALKAGVPWYSEQLV